MSLLSNFIVAHVIQALEQEFISHEPDLQKAFLDEVSAFTSQIVQWLESRLSNDHSNDAEASNEEK
jgi:hypothetical protein